MADLDKTIFDLKEVANYFFDLYRRACDNGTITKQYDRFLAVNNAINVFKGMKPVKPLVGMGKVYCGKCNAVLGEGHPLYCWHCGKAVEWGNA